MSRWRNEDMYVVGDEIVGEDEIGALVPTLAVAIPPAPGGVPRQGGSTGDPRLGPSPGGQPSGGLTQVLKGVAVHLHNARNPLVLPAPTAGQIQFSLFEIEQALVLIQGVLGLGGPTSVRSRMSTSRAPAKPSFFKKLFG